jgi:hypothetical protein
VLHVPNGEPTDDTYFEPGFNLGHGFLTEYVVDEPEHIICNVAAMEAAQSTAAAGS